MGPIAISSIQAASTANRMAWQWAETLVEIRGTLVDIRGTTKLGCRYHFPKHKFNRLVCLEAHHYLLAEASQAWSGLPQPMAGADNALMAQHTTENTAFPLTYLHRFHCWALFWYYHLFSMDSCELYHYMSHGKLWLIYKKMFVAQFTRFIGSSQQK